MLAALFATGFGFGALSATGIGYLADHCGRKKACLAYCILYSLSSALTMLNNRSALFAGRALGGVSTTLLYSVFEAWMVAKASMQENSNASIQSTLASAASINAVVAICAGFISEVLAFVFQTKKAPFAGSIVCLVFAASIIIAHWVR
jgi:MFS family permease